MRRGGEGGSILNFLSEVNFVIQLNFIPFFSTEDIFTFKIPFNSAINFILIFADENQEWFIKALKSVVMYERWRNVGEIQFVLSVVENRVISWEPCQ